MHTAAATAKDSHPALLMDAGRTRMQSTNEMAATLTGNRRIRKPAARNRSVGLQKFAILIKVSFQFCQSPVKQAGHTVACYRITDKDWMPVLIQQETMESRIFRYA